MEQDTALIGKGLYTIPEAATLLGIPAPSIRRWSLGYAYRKRAEIRSKPPVWSRELIETDGSVALTFLDLMEARFIDAFRKHKVSWGAIREASKMAAEMFGDAHPFTRKRFRTDGKRIFTEIERQGQIKLFDLNRRGWVFHEIVEPSLYRDVEFENDQTARWFPLYPSKAIVVDPVRSFGRPITAEGIPTDTLVAGLVGVGQDIQAASAWFGIPVATVRAAMAFERRFGPNIPRAEAA
jgi:uncharacterized protein (DUF433 family)